MFGWLFGKRGKAAAGESRPAEAGAETPDAERRPPILVEHTATPVDPIAAPDIIHPPTTPDDPSGGDKQ